MGFRDISLSRFCAAGMWLPLSMPLAALQTPTVAVEEGDPLVGIGSVTRVDNLVINDRGDWLVEVDTDHANRDQDGALVSATGVAIREGLALATPPGAAIDAFDTLTLNSGGKSAWNFLLSGTAGLSDNSGAFFGTNLLIQESGFSLAPQLTPGTTYVGFFELKLNANDQILMVASVDDPAIPTSVDRVLVAMTVDGSGNLATENVLAKEGDTPPGQIETIVDFGTGPHAFALNAAGDVLFFAGLTGPLATDGTIYLNSTLLAQEGSASPVAGRNWANLANPEVDLNDNGAWVFSGRIDGDTATDRLIEKSGAKFVQEGDTLPDISPFLIEDFGSGPILISNDGDVLWFGEWNDPDPTRDTGLFLNDELIVQEGVTTAHGVVIDSLRGIVDGYDMSPSGQWVIFEAILADGTEGSYLLNLGGFTDLPSCSGNPATLAHGSGQAKIGQSFTLEADNAQAIGALPLLFISNSAFATFPPCGLMTGFGEILIDIFAPNPVATLTGTPWTGTPVPFGVTLLNDPGLIGRSFFSQALFIDFSGGPEKFRLSDAVRVDIGP